MADEIKFDFGKAQSLGDVIAECGRGLEEIKNALQKEVGDAGEWWKGGAYDAFKAKYEGKGAAMLDGLCGRTSDAGAYLVKISNAKHNFEKSNRHIF
ncbi:hypothetical protein AGMMS49975_02210 [Clostridia bacterium]|nr:hypothetical protein AGMMS49975_02210 [Clostridia bacterium]